MFMRDAMDEQECKKTIINRDEEIIVMTLSF